MIPGIDSTKLKYMTTCLLKVNKDAPVQMGEEMISTKDYMHCTMLTIENTNGGKVIDTQPYIARAEDIAKGLNRFKGTISFSEDGRTHNIGMDVTVCHTRYVPGDIGTTVKALIEKKYPLRASISTAALNVLAGQDMKSDPIVYIRNDADGHYIGILDNIRVKMRGNIEPASYSTFAATFLKKLAAMARNTVTVEWMPEGVVRFSWETYGLTMRYYIAPRVINDENIIKRLDRKVIL